jgi:ATP-dependent helicase/nuclease subunit A
MASQQAGLPDENSDTSDENSSAVVEEDQPDNIQLEARLVVNKIKELMRPDANGRIFNVYDRGRKEYRSVEYRDIVILLRTTRNWSEIFMDELTAGGIPAYADTGTGYFSTIEVQTILSLLQIIDNPMQDIPLLSVLRSPIAEFTAEELIDIRLEDRENTLFEAMLKMASKEGRETASKEGHETASKEGHETASKEEHGTALKVRAFLDRLKAWRDKSAYLPVDELIWYLYSETGYFTYTGAMPGGVQRQANLRILFERARKFQETSYKGYSILLTLLES